MYVTMRKADCDSPSPINAFGTRPASGSGPDGCRMAWAVCEKMSYEKLSPG